MGAERPTQPGSEYENESFPAERELTKKVLDHETSLAFIGDQLGIPPSGRHQLLVDMIQQKACVTWEIDADGNLEAYGVSSPKGNLYFTDFGTRRRIQMPKLRGLHPGH